MTESSGASNFNYQFYPYGPSYPYPNYPVQPVSIPSNQTVWQVQQPDNLALRALEQAIHTIQPDAYMDVDELVERARKFYAFLMNPGEIEAADTP